MGAVTTISGFLATTLCVSAAFAQSMEAGGVYLPPLPGGGPNLVISGAVRFLGIDPAKLEVREPLRLYNGGSAESLAAGRLDATDTNTYFYGIFAANQPLGWALLKVDANGVERLTSVTSSAPDKNGSAPPLPLASSVDSALKRLATQKELQSSSYEARLLTIIGTTGSLPFYVLWLKPTTGEDWIYTLEQRFKPNGVETQRLYSTAEYMKLIQPVVQQRPEEIRKQPANSSLDPYF